MQNKFIMKNEDLCSAIAPKPIVIPAFGLAYNFKHLLKPSSYITPYIILRNSGSFLTIVGKNISDMTKIWELCFSTDVFYNRKGISKMKIRKKIIKPNSCWQCNISPVSLTYLIQNCQVNFGLLSIIEAVQLMSAKYLIHFSINFCDIKQFSQT